MKNLNGHFDSLNIKISIKIFLFLYAYARARIYEPLRLLCVLNQLLLMTNVRVECELYEAIQIRIDCYRLCDVM